MSDSSMTGGQEGVLIVTGILVAISLIASFFMGAFKTNSFNSGSSIGVNSTASRDVGDLFGTLFNVYFPISLIWLGPILSIIQGNFAFMIPTYACLLSSVSILLVGNLFFSV